MKFKVTDNLFLKVLSVFLAVVLWLIIVNINDAQGTIQYTREVTLLNTDVITENGKVFRVEEGTNIVKITIKARKSVLRELKPSDFILTADMEKNLKYDSMVGISVDCRNRNINVDTDVTLDRSNVNVSIEDSATEQFQVIVSHIGKENDGLMVGSMVPEQTIIKITGPVSIVERIERVEAVVDVTGLPASSVKNCSLKLYDSAGNNIDPTYLNFVGKTDGIHVTVSMLSKKTVPIIFTYEGVPADGYRVKEVEWKPEFIEIAGNSGVLAGLNSIQVPSSVINVDGINEEQQLVVDIKPYLPSGVILADETNASVLVIIELEHIKAGENAEQTRPENSKPGDGAEDTTEKENSSEKEENIGENSGTEGTDSSTQGENVDQNNKETESKNDDNTEGNS